MIKLYVLANTVVFKNAISGGDVILPRLLTYSRQTFAIHVIGTSHVINIWRDFKLPVTYHVYNDTLLDRLEWLPLIPLAYLVRTMNAWRVLNTILTKEQSNTIVYTASDLYPDIIPAFLGKKRYPNVSWVSIIHHLNSAPWVKEGLALKRTFSFLAQRLGLFFIENTADIILVVKGGYIDVCRLFNHDKRIVSLSHGVDLAAMKRFNRIRRKRYDAVWVGMLTSSRGIYDLVKIWRMVVTYLPTAKLALIGGGSSAAVKELQARMKRYGIEKNIDYFGFVPKRDDVYAIMAASRLYLSTRHEGGWDLPALEAFALGLPCIAYKTAVFASVFHQGFISVPLNNTIAFDQKVVLLLSSKKHYRRLARQAYLQASKYSIISSALTFDNCLKRLLR